MGEPGATTAGSAAAQARADAEAARLTSFVKAYDVRGLVGSHLAGELLELGDVEGGCVELGSHDVVLSLGARIGAVDHQRARHDGQRTVAAMTGS